MVDETTSPPSCQAVSASRAAALVPLRRPGPPQPAGRAAGDSSPAWAVLHVIRRHGGRVETTVVLEVDVPRGWLRRSRKGLRYVLRDVPPERIKRASCFSELAGASTEAA
jgi:hypothetical protein